MPIAANKEDIMVNRQSQWQKVDMADSEMTTVEKQRSDIDIQNHV